jgi:hypothetical protein
MSAKGPFDILIEQNNQAPNADRQSEDDAATAGHLLQRTFLPTNVSGIFSLAVQVEN